jgi:hypothetical protein
MTYLRTGQFTTKYPQGMPNDLADIPRPVVAPENLPVPSPHCRRAEPWDLQRDGRLAYVGQDVA